MKTEYEVRVLEIDKEEIIKKIEELGGTLEGIYDQRRYTYDTKPKSEGKWIRLRTTGDITTLAIKEVTSNKIDGTKELEIEVSEFEDTNKIMMHLGYDDPYYQENKRTRYTLNDVELDIDEWPLIPAYLEIEAKNEEKIEETINLLGIDKLKVTTNKVKSIFKEIYQIDIDEVRELKF